MCFKQTEKATHEMRKYLQIMQLMRLKFRICKELLQVNDNNKLHLKMNKRLIRCFSKEDIQRGNSS